MKNKLSEITIESLTGIKDIELAIKKIKDIAQLIDELKELGININIKDMEIKCGED